MPGGMLETRVELLREVREAGGKLVLELEFLMQEKPFVIA
jgi:hypothetical protein